MCHSSSAVCGAKVKSDDQRVDRLAQHRDRLRLFDAPDRRLGARSARGVFSLDTRSLTSSISDDTAVFRCTRCSMSAVTRRIVVRLRWARSLSVSPTAVRYPSPPIVSAQ
jgi:hypothetical protein